MDAYLGGFANVYDLYMDDIPYDQWCDNILALFKKHKMPMEIVCELGCGTGQMTRRLFKAGFDMIGIDMSYDMLMQAMENNEEGKILYLNQDMRDFELYGTVGAIVSVCDSMNYLADIDELKTVLKLCNNYLDPKGLLIFDLKTVHYYENLGSSVIAENRENGSFIWENEYDPKTRDNGYYLTIYEENEEGTFDRFEEEHLQHAFTIEEVKSAIEESGLEFIEVLDVATMDSAKEDSDRIYFIAREVTK